MNKDIITQTLQEILAERPDFFFPKQLHILTWKSKRVKDALITKINGQRYLGTLRKDSQGQDYWRYKLLPNSEESEVGSVAKFQQRQAKTQEINHDQENSEPAVNQQFQSNS